MSARDAAAATGAALGRADAQLSPEARISAHERELLVAQLAYSRAEKRGFAAGKELQDWLEAEAEVELLLG